MTRQTQPSLLQMAVLYRTYADAVEETGLTRVLLKALAPLGRLSSYRGDFSEYVRRGLPDDQCPKPAWLAPPRP